MENPELQQAIALANKLLDEPGCDPDDDLRVLSRQLLRKVEVLQRIEIALGSIRAETERLIAGLGLH